MALHERAMELIPGATQLISRRPNRVAYGVSPVYAARAQGARFGDVDGFEYIDRISGVGSIILESGPTLRTYDENVHNQLCERIVQIREEHRGRWSRLLSMIPGSGSARSAP